MKAELRNKTVAVVGLGLTGNACVRFLLAQGAQVIGFDTRTHLQVDLGIEVHLGELNPSKLMKVDLVIVSPGVDPREPALQISREKGVAQYGDVELFARFNQRPVIAITGSNGKSTVATLVADMCSAAGMNALLGGNIGTPVLELLDKPGDILVLELSSFQLESLSSLRPLVACMLNLSDDHLDRHGTLAAYKAAKQRVFIGSQCQVVNRQDEHTWSPQRQKANSFGLNDSAEGWSWDSQTDHLLFNGQPVLDMKACVLGGEHNILNIQAASACAHAAGAKLAPILEAAKRFSGLPHRFEVVSQRAGVIWINDSKATNAGAAVAAVESARHQYQGKLTLIAGGDAKGANLSVMQPVLERHVDHLITLGKDGPALARLKDNAVQVTSMLEAVSEAHRISEVGDVVLLSPACASLDMFSSYQQRGDAFAQAIREVAA